MGVVGFTRSAPDHSEPMVPNRYPRWSHHLRAAFAGTLVDTLRAHMPTSSSGSSPSSGSLLRLQERARRLRKFTRRYPFLRPVVDRVGLVVWRRQLRRNAPPLPGGNATPLLVDPADIGRAVWRKDLLSGLGLSSQRELVGRIEGGNWDEAGFPLSDLTFFDAVDQHFNEHVDWDDTEFYREVRASLEAGVPLFKYRTVDDIPRQQERIRSLHDSMQRDGYRTQEELSTSRPWDEIVVAIDRRGRLLFVDGRHRLAVARALGLDEVSVVVGLRHRDWVAKRAEMAAYVESTGHPSYQPLVHPDLAFIPSRVGDDRLPLFLPALPPAPATVVDIGSNKGFFCHVLEQAGYHCVAIERSDKEAYFLRMIRDACERDFEVVHGAVQEFDWDRRVDAVLALNVFHHFLKSEATFGELEDLLPRIDAEVMIFEPHLPEDPQMRSAYRNFAPDEFVEFVIAHSAFTQSRPLGSAGDGRPLFLLSR